MYLPRIAPVTPVLSSQLVTPDVVVLGIGALLMALILARAFAPLHRA